jgi:hypothetical protein
MTAASAATASSMRWSGSRGRNVDIVAIGQSQQDKEPGGGPSTASCAAR